METSCTFVIYVPHSKLYISKYKQGFLIASLDKPNWHLQACNINNRMRPRIGWKMKINIDVAIPIVTNGLVFQILTIWQAIKMDLISFSFHIPFIFLFFMLKYLPFFFSFSNVSFNKCLTCPLNVISSWNLNHVIFN
jgi:hypothetical protein